MSRKSAKVEEFFKVAKLDQMSAQIMKQTMDQVKSGVLQQMLGAKLSSDQQQRLNEFSDKVTKVVADALSRDNLEPEYAKLYAEAYTEQQIDDILAFYKSPTGQVMVERSPGLMKQSSAIAQQRLTAVTPELQQLMKDFIAQEANKAQQAKPKE